MAVRDFHQAGAPARALALILSADGSVHERALDLLDGLGAFAQLGMGRERFAELASECSRQIAPGLCERSWLSDEDLAHAEALLDAVGEPVDRRLVCRLAAAAMEEEGLVTHGARLLLEHALAHWAHRSGRAISGQPLGPRSMSLPRWQGPGSPVLAARRAPAMASAAIEG